MDIDQLRYFIEVADRESFTRAAEHLGKKQPSLSQQISNLEKEVGQPLFERLSRRVQLTDAGRFLYERAIQVLALIEDTKTRINHLDESGRGRLRVAAIPTIAPYYLPELLKDFVQHFPEAQVEVQEDVTEELLRSCLNGELDLGILALPIEEEQLHVEALFEEELFVVMSPRNRLAKKRNLNLKDLTQEPMLLLKEAHCLSEQIVNFCRQRDVQPITTARSTQLSTLQEMVSLDHGISLIPAMARVVDQSKQRLYRSVSGKPPKRTVAMVWHKHRFRSRLVREMIEMMRADAIQRME